MENTKQIKDLTLQTGVNGNEDILIQNNGVTKRIKSGEFLTEHQDISHLATKTSVSSLETEVSNLKKSALTEHQDISHLALKTEIPSLDGYATEIFVINKISEAELGGGSGNIDLSGYVTEDELNAKGYLTQHQSLDHLALKGHKHEEYLTEHQSLGHLALKEHKHEEYLTEHQDISHLATKTSVSSLESEVSNLKKSVSDGKELIASAITDKGVNTSKTDSFQTMAANISKISGDNDDVLLAYSFENDVRGNAHGTILLHTQNEDTLGEYSIHWGDDNGVLSEYEEISFLTTTASSKLKTYEFIPLNAIPDNATRIIALHNGVISADFKIPDNKRLNINDKLFSYGALSDIHIDGDGDDDGFTKSDFAKEISYFETNGAVAICNSGDITRDGYEHDVAAILPFINNTNLPIYTARGNHDNANDCSGLDNELYLSIEPNGNLFLKEINGEIFIFCGIISSSAGGSSVFDDAQITQLSAWLKTYKDRRVFLHEHVFFGETGNIYNLYNGSGMSDSGNAGEFKKLMSKYRNVILCTGHSHLDFSLQRLGDHANIVQRTDTLCHRVHIPSASRPRYNDIDTPDIKDNTYVYKLGAQGYLIDVYRDFIILKGRDFSKDKNLPYATYILDTTPISIENLTIPVNFGEKTFTKQELTITFDNTLITYNGTTTSTPNLMEACTCANISGDFKTDVTYYLQLIHEGGSVSTTNRPEILDVSITTDYGTTYIIQKDEKTLDDIYERIEFNFTNDCSSFVLIIRPKGNMIFNNYALSAIIGEA